jgi:hypothetical protein
MMRKDPVRSYPGSRRGAAEADRLGIPVVIEKVTDYAAIAGYGVASTPGVVIDDKVVHAGGLPKTDDVTRWFRSIARQP